MIRYKLYSWLIAIALFVSTLALSMTLVSCSDDDEALSSSYGYVQFMVYKSSQNTRADSTSTRAEVDELDRLYDAQKVRVVLEFEGSTITQTLVLNAYNKDNAEYGMQSEKLQLVAGNYTVVGFYLYDNLDEPLYSGISGDTFTIVPGGLEVQPLYADAVGRGEVTFKLIKALSETRADEGEYPFENIKIIDIAVRNTFTREITTFDSIPVSITDSFDESQTYTGTDGQEHHYQSSYGKCSGTYMLTAGNYEISSYTTYSDTRRRTSLETVALSSSPVFTVEDNKSTEDVEVPIQLSGTAEYIKDYLALKVIWEKLGGKDWCYYGEEQSMGVNWNFNKDIDLWGNQPGVTTDANGRIETIELQGFGPSGNIPDEIGQLSELKVLSLGTHTELIGGSISSAAQFTQMSDEQKKEFRMNYRDNVLSRDIRENLSDGLKDYINRDPSKKSIKSVKRKDVSSGTMTNGITGISKAVMRCQQLQMIYVANCPMTHYFVEVENPEYSTEGYSWSTMEDFTDIEIYNTKLTELPVEMMADLPNLQTANLSRNPEISSETMLQNFKDLLKGEFANCIQILYLGYNNLEDTPEFLSSEYNQMVKLALLDITNNKLKHIYPFGQEINIMDFYLDYNELTELPVHTDGYFFGYYDCEEFTVTHNKLKALPNAFNAHSNYVIDSFDASYNEIIGIGVDANGNPYSDFKGINATSLNLSYNRMTEFPSELFSSDSPIYTLMLNGNGIKEIKDGALKGNRSYCLETLDMGYNQLESIADDEFSSIRLPYLYGLGLSYNKFSSFPLGPLYNRTMTVMEIRGQRDDEGNRCLTEWPTGLYTNVGLLAFYIGSNDLRKIDDTISTRIYIFDIADNPNIQIDLTDVCYYIQAGYYMLIYDKTQDIRGCDYLFEY